MSDRLEEMAFDTIHACKPMKVVKYEDAVAALESARAEIARLQKEADVTFVNAAHEAIADRDRLKALAENAEPFLRELSEWGCMKEECDWVAACPQSKLPIEEWCISCRADAALEDTK